MSELAYINRKRQLVKANSETTVYVTGEYFAVLAATGAFKIGIEDGPLHEWEAGLEVGNPDSPNGQRQRFRYLRIADLSGVDNIVDLVAGGGDFADRRLTVSGTLNVQGVAGGTAVAVDTAPAGVSYARAATVLAGGVGNPSVAQIFNPVASGIVVLVDEIQIVETLGISLTKQVAQFDTALANLVGVGFPVDRRDAAGLAELRWANANAAAFYAGSNTYKLFGLGTDAEDRPASPYVLEAGQGLIVRIVATNQRGDISFQWRELPA